MNGGWGFTWALRHDLPHRALRVAMDRDELRHALANPGAAPLFKGMLPLISPATFTGDRRALVNVERVYMLGLDIDTPTPDPAALVAAVRRALGDVEVHAYSTASSELGAFRMRMLVPYDEPATGEQHRASWALVRRVLERAGVSIDRACSDPSRGFYVWAVPRSGAYFHAHIPGPPWPVARAAAVEAERQAEEAAERARQAAERPVVDPTTLRDRASVYLARCEPAIAGQNGHAVTFAVAARLLHRVGLTEAEALDLMLREYNPRCSPPWSERELRRKVREAATKTREIGT